MTPSKSQSNPIKFGDDANENTFSDFCIQASFFMDRKVQVRRLFAPILLNSTPKVSFTAIMSFGVKKIIENTTSTPAVPIKTDFPYPLHKKLGTSKSRKDVTVFDFFFVFDSHTAPILEARILPQRLRRQFVASEKLFF